MQTVDRSIFESGGFRPKMKMNREYILRREVATEFNTYLSFSPFATFSDVMPGEDRAAMYDQDGVLKKDADPKVGALGVRSIFNKYGAVLTGSRADVDVIQASEWRISNNVPLIDSPENRQKMRLNSGCTIKELVDASQAGILGSATYAYSDFMYCKYLGQMPNSYLITLRRFPIPPDDYISSAGIGATRKEVDSSNALPIGQLVTWMNTPGNNLDQILTYSVSMPYEEKQAKLESAGTDADASSKPLNAASALFDKSYRKQVAGGYAGAAIKPYIPKFFPFDDAPYHGLLGAMDSNKIYGPVDAIKKVYYRGDQGIDFEQSFKLTFEYELRSYNGINGRQAMLDLISNILNVTYTTGTFWGGGYVGGGAHQNNIFSNLNIMKCNGGFTDFMDAFANDMSTVKSQVSSTVKANGGILNTIKNFLNDLGGMLVGGMLNKLGRPQKSQVASLLSPAPTGLWHVTIGNPFHPIMSLGNMILKKTTITHTGPLGLDDFPTGIKVECELDRGKPRDLRGIEMIYMNGNDRIYSSMGPKVFDMYTHAKAYKSDGTKIEVSSSDVAGYTSMFTDRSILSKKLSAAELKKFYPQDMSGTKNVLMKYFGRDDTYSIYVAAAEQEWGAGKKNSTGNTQAHGAGTGR